MATPEQLDEACARVAADVASSGDEGVFSWSLDDGIVRAHIDGYDSTHDGGFFDFEEAGLADAIIYFAGVAQDFVMDGQQRAWPVCTTHGLGLHPSTEPGGPPFWLCQYGRHQVAVIGQLATPS